MIFPSPVKHADSRSNLRCVGEGLYVGSAFSVTQTSLRGNPWWAVVDCHGPRHEEAVRREIAFTSIPRVLRVGFPDGTPVPTELLAGAEAMYRALQGPMLVACAAGISRSVSVAVALLMVVRGLPYETALLQATCDGGRPLAVTIGSAKAWAEQRIAEISVLTEPRVALE